MKTLIRAFFRTLRVVLGPFMLLKERLSRPDAMVREPAAQAAVDLQCQSLVLYQFSTCPFCIKVRQEMHRLSLPIELRDSQNNSVHRSELLQSTGNTQVPCLKITDHNGQTRWLKESSAIVAYVRERFEAPAV